MILLQVLDREVQTVTGIITLDTCLTWLDTLTRLRVVTWVCPNIYPMLAPKYVLFNTNSSWRISVKPREVWCEDKNCSKAARRPAPRSEKPSSGNMRTNKTLSCRTFLMPLNFMLVETNPWLEHEVMLCYQDIQWTQMFFFTATK